MDYEGNLIETFWRHQVRAPADGSGGECDAYQQPSPPDVEYGALQQIHLGRQRSGD